MIGFLKDVRRLNVSITRARHGLIIIGDGHCLAKSIGEGDNKYSIWRYLIKYYQDLGVIVNYIEGEEGEKMFKPTKIIENEGGLEEYLFNEYDFDGSGNKPFIKDDIYMDDSFFYKDNYIKRYINDDEFFSDFNDEYLNNENDFLREFFNKFDGDFSTDNGTENFHNMTNNIKENV